MSCCQTYHCDHIEEQIPLCKASTTDFKVDDLHEGIVEMS